jgi:spore coat polysaccharide biosynthesis protein SpsF
VKLLEAPEIIKYRNDLRFTIDTPEDFENMQKLYQIIEKEGGDFSLENLVHTTDEHPEIKQVMGEGIARFSK